MDIGYFNTENFRKRQHLSIQKLGIIGIGYEDTKEIKIVDKFDRSICTRAN